MSIFERVEVAKGAELPAEHVEGRSFMTWERADSFSVAGTTPLLMLDDPALQGDRAIYCLCGCGCIADHNAQASRIIRELGALGYDFERRQ